MSITTIMEEYLSYGLVRYFEGDKCLNRNALQGFNQGKIFAKELVTFDCGLMELNEIEKDNIKVPKNQKQVLAVIVRPEIERNYPLERDTRFDFCGYDLVDLPCCISAITNCGAGFEKAINYSSLNEYGLIPTYKEAVLTQLKLNEEYPDESHAYCEIVEIWRYQTRGNRCVAD